MSFKEATAEPFSTTDLAKRADVVGKIPGVDEVSFGQKWIHDFSVAVQTVRGLGQVLAFALG